jgi:CRP-like cAMP-binding protein
MLSGFRDRTSLVFNSPLLSALGPAERLRFVSFCHERIFRAGERIYDSGDPATGLYLIVRGNVRIKAVSSDKSETSQLLKEPGAFGVLGLTPDTFRTASAYAETDATLLGFFRSDLDLLSVRAPRLALKIYKIIHRIAMLRLDLLLDAGCEEIGKPAVLLELEILPEHFDQLMAG